MKIDGLRLANNSVAENLTIASGEDFPPAEQAGELFYKLGTGAGLCIFDGIGWSPLGSVFVAGEIKLTANENPPAGWLICNGQQVFASEWPQLFDAIGYTYGNFQEQFALPDLRNRVPMQVGLGELGINVALGTTGGKDGQDVEFTLDVSQMPAHSHSSSGTLKASNDEAADPAPTNGGYLATAASTGTSVTDVYISALGGSGTVELSGVTVEVGDTGGGDPVIVGIPATLPAYLGLNYIIYAGTRVV